MKYSTSSCFGSVFVERCWDFEMQGSLISENLLTRLPSPPGKLRRKEKSSRIGSPTICVKYLGVSGVRFEQFQLILSNFAGPGKGLVLEAV